jgi:cephalosporin-C deacetylase
MYVEEAKKLWGSYFGSQSKPADFEQFWDNGKRIIQELEQDYQLIPHEVYSTVAQGYDLFFHAHDDAKIHCQLLQPKNNQGPWPVQFQFHGYHGSSGDWGDKIGLVAEGYCVVAMDVRGQGGASQDYSQTNGGTLKGHIIRGVEDGPEKLFYRQVFLDIYQLTQLICQLPDIDETRMSVYGASQGGALALVCAALEPKIQQSFVLYPFLSDYREAFRLNVTDSAYEELAYWFRFRDPMHLKEALFFQTLDYIDIQYLVNRVKGKVIWGIGLEDKICPPKTQFAVFNQLTCEKEMIAFPEYGHEYIPCFGDKIRKELIKKEQKT